MVWLKYGDGGCCIYYYMVIIMVELLYLATHMDIVHLVTRVHGLQDQESLLNVYNIQETLKFH